MLQVLDVGFRPDERIGNYRVEHELGPTGSGILIQAHHLVLPRRAILKVVHQAFAVVQSYVLQTLREACILEAVAHPGVPIVYESGLLRDRRPWFAFEQIRGPTLEDLLARGALPVIEVAGLIRDLADILEHAHRRGVIHRGLRPDRIVVTSERRFPLCIPDWSEAIAHDASDRVAHPAISGSSAYVAPELAQAEVGPHGPANGPHGPHGPAQGQAQIDDRVDMFALGVIGYRALTGVLPGAADGDPTARVPALELRPDAPRELTALIDSLLAFDRFDRPSASEVRGDLDWLLGTLLELQQRAAPREASPVAPVAREDVVRVEAPRLRRPRWTPNVRYLEATEVDIVVPEDDLAKQ